MALRIKDNVDLKELEDFGFKENEFHPNYVYETRAKSGSLVVVLVDGITREITGHVNFIENIKMNEEQIKHFCSNIFEKGFVEKVGGER